ncbi:hypothetical protein H5T58_00565, partial [Candidatus Parcubacteria bacterium]|nr:hypothetical protein [Candidatus Parcubacteria bacterium]
MKFNFNPSKSKILFFFWFCLVHFFIFVPKSLNGAILYLEPTSGQFFEGDSFVLKVKIDSEGECINTVKATLNFSQDLLEAIDFTTGDSIL